MNDHQRQEILAFLDKGSTALLDALKNVPVASAVRSPGPGEWSILQCVEHLAVSEDYLFSQILASQHSQTPFVNKQLEALIVARGVDRSRRVESPLEGQPAEQFSTLPEAVQHFLASRERTMEFVRENEEDLRSKITSHPLFGKVNCYETLLIMAVHPLRHAKQIEQIKAALGS